ncbi:MAG: DUF86 domain-containing protein [Spirochaetaceae bacterium]|jgi:uncharacterized protein with HEPN domain|nr:DUF86 domain-containing protein [Spirochaetaceae bacterium]
MDNKNKAYIWDMLQASKEILDFVDGMTFHDFERDKRTRYAVERQLLVIGEAANHISEDFQHQNDNIPWKNIIGLRNIIAHDYGEILSERIWLVIKNNLPVLVESLNEFF